MSKAELFFTQEEKERILKTIQEAEKNTSGEIRVHFEDNCEGDVLDCAAYMFGKLQMHKTKERNGVLFYIAIENRKFAILGDAGINAVVPPNFWDTIKEQMLANFKDGKIIEGLISGIQMSGEALKKFFPYNANTDVNELPDDLSFGK